MKNAFRTSTSWSILYWRSGFWALFGIVLICAEHGYLSSIVAFLSSIMLVEGLLAIRFWQVNRVHINDTNWYLAAGLLDSLTGIFLLLYRDNPTMSIGLILGGWALVVAMMQAVETMYVFLGVQSSGKIRDFSITITHLINVLICGGIAFIVLEQPLRENSIRWSGLLFIGFSISLLILTRRLQIDVSSH